MWATSLLLLLILGVAACGPAVPLPDVIDAHDPDFPLVARSACEPRLLAAVKRRDVATIRALAAEHVAMSCGDPLDPPPLDRAILEDQVDVVTALLESGADPNMRWSSHGDRAPLNSAIAAEGYYGPRLHRAELVSLLVKHGADVNGRWCEFESRLASGSVPGCVASGAPTALISATYRNQPDTVSLLLDAGANATAADAEGHIALDHAPNDMMFGLLLMRTFASEQEAVRDFTVRVPPPYGREQGGDTALHTALRRSSYGVVRLLLGAGADPNVRTTNAYGGDTPLALALMQQSQPFVRLLLEHGADPNARVCFLTFVQQGKPGSLDGCTVERGLTPLMLASRFAPISLSDLLVSKGADASARDWRGRSADDHAVAARRH